MARRESGALHRAVHRALPALLCTLISAPVLAQPAPKPDARNLFREAKAEGTRGHWGQALSLMKQAWAEQHAYDIAGNLGIAEMHNGHFAAAAQAFSYCLAHFPATGDLAKRRITEHQLDEVKKKVAQIEVAVTPPTATLSVDGTPVERDAGPDIFVEPGSHTINAAAPGFDTLSKTVQAAKGSKQSVVLALVKSTAADQHDAAAGSMPNSGLGATPAPAPSPPQDTQPVPPSTKPPLWPVWVGGGVAVVGLGLGIGFTLAASSKQSDADSLSASLPGANACGAGSPYASTCARLHDANSAVGTDHGVALAGFIAGGVGAAFSIGYVIWRANSTRSSKESREVRPALVVANGGASLTLNGSF